MQRRPRLTLITFILVAWGATAGAAALHAQIDVDQWPNSPQPSHGRQIVPFMEGWYDNGDGTYTISFGYLNRNANDPVDIPLGERNYIEPSKYDGVQPTHFMGSRQRGMFGITIPEAERDQDIWWHIVAEDGTDYKVPGRTNAGAYQLDWYPRPHGSLPPLVWFDNERDAKRGPEGIHASRTLTARVGQPVTIAVSTRDDSERDRSDRRFEELPPVRVVFSKYSGPDGEVTFERHPSTPEPTPGAGRGFGRGGPPGPDQVMLDGVAGTARVNVTFSAPGEYVIQAKSDNWRAPDSADQDQCCWSNAYQAVSVSP
jgi:hypothetical protein